MYAEARLELSNGAWQKARDLFQKLESRYPFGRHAQQALMEIAYTYYKEGESAQAIQTADRFIRQYPNHPNVDYVYYLKGLASFDEDLGFLGRILNQDISERDPKAAREAFDAFKDLVNRFPESRYADDARARMRFLVNSQAQGELNVAKFYYCAQGLPRGRPARADGGARLPAHAGRRGSALPDGALVRGAATEGPAVGRRARPGDELSEEPLPAAAARSSQAASVPSSRGADRNAIASASLRVRANGGRLASTVFP